MKNPIPLPAVRALRKLGQDIRDARRRRRITMKLMAERTGLSLTTIGKIQKGDPTTSIGNYASGLFVLGMVHRLEDVADVIHDSVGRQMDEDRLPQRIRLPNKKVSSKKKN